LNIENINSQTLFSVMTMKAHPKYILTA